MPYHLVHVGKCAGESVIRSLQPQVPDLQTYHVFDANLRLANAVLRRDPSDIFIVLTRDPVDRFVSAFEWDLHSKSVDGDGRRLQNEIWGRIFGAFQTANDLAEALTDPAAGRRQMAVSALTTSKLHMQFDLGWYLPPYIAAELPAGRTHLIRTERIGSDLARFMASQGLRKVEAPVTKNSYKHRLPPERVTKTMSELARRNVRLASHATYATLALIESRLADPEAAVLS
ncbi:hypothetical protein [Cereibacter azotoformans]|uniref:hypothetical protein n=1 Tax=Cereibacter azotoformans TaxID=43057 RepID=UPI000D396737|nr:hypothetical protein [Cereibacter azotoformans]